MPSTIVWIAAGLIGAFLLSYVDHRSFNRHARRVIKTLSPIEMVIASSIDQWEPEPLQTARIYAEGLLTGTVTAITDTADWESVPIVLGHAIYQDDGVNGGRWHSDYDAEEWQIGIGSLHSLANGEIESYETGRRYGVETDVSMPWLLYAHDLKGTGLTMDDVAAAFTGDLLAASLAFLRASAALPIQR